MIPFSVPLTDFLQGLALNIRDSARHASFLFAAYTSFPFAFSALLRVHLDVGLVRGPESASEDLLCNTRALLFILVSQPRTVFFELIIGSETFSLCPLDFCKVDLKGLPIQLMCLPGNQQTLWLDCCSIPISIRISLGRTRSLFLFSFAFLLVVQLTVQ